jgi:hypothetical protein
MDEKVENSNLDEIMKDSTLNNPELTFCEKTTYLDFLLSNAQTEEEKDEIKKTINDFLEISKEDETEIVLEEAPLEEDDVEIEKIEDVLEDEDVSEDESIEIDEDDETDGELVDED